jgi:glycosyltransferase involved in cell wall biosynthesis
VTPSYNTAGFIAETIASVLSQAGDFTIEYFVMDGGSTDGTTDIIASHADQLAAGTWPRSCAGITMEWVSRPDGGQSHAINQGLRHATGDFVGWINSDDAYAPGAFACVAEQFARHPEADFVYGDGDVIDATGGLQWRWLSRPYDLRVLTSYHFLWNDFTNYIMQQSAFWRREVLDRIGYLDEAFHYAMDAEYWIRAGSRGLTLHHVPRSLARFRLIPGTKSLSSATAFWEDYLEIFRRHRGVKRLAKYFGFYYYNLGRQCDFDLRRLMDSKHAILRRWDTLPSPDREQVAREAERGFRLGCFLIAHDLLERDLAEDASLFAREAVGGGLSAASHPFAWPYLTRRLLGATLYGVAQGASRALIRRFRAHRYDYRYREVGAR